MSEPVPGGLLEQVRAALGEQYEVERALGAGGMGSVLLGRDLTLDRAVAIKVISPELSSTKSFRQRFLQEARTVARLRHPNIVAVYAAGEAAGLLFFVMEYVPGESLRDLITREGKVEPDRAIRILRQLADGLGYAHAQGVIHRDIKPENILLDADSGRAMITDFGVATALSSSGDERMTGTGFIVGSPRYMSPEQAAGERTLDGRSDIYSLGLVGYEMVAGAPAFEGDSAVSIIAKQITEPPPPLADRVNDLPAELPHAIEKALAKSPGERWQTAGEMATALGDSSGETARASSSGIRRAQARRRTRVIAAVAAVALIAVASLAWSLTRGDGVPDGVDPRKSFLVAPFENQTGDPSLAWLREGSVNMLTLNLSEWRDLNVVDYERTLDLLQKQNIAEGARVGLEEARQLAREAKAWTVVLGSISKEMRDSLTVTARVYDVASGREVDRARVSAALDADPRGIFDRLSRELLDLAGAPAMVVEHAKKTSTSLEAYRAYLAGVRELNSLNFDSADAALERAITADSTFALAYYKRALLRGWRKQLIDTSDVVFARQAAKYADRLPERERMIVNAYLDLTQGITAQMIGGADAAQKLQNARTQYAALIQRDSTDAEGWYGLGDAYFHTPAQGQEWIRNMDQAMKAFRRTLALDSTMHLAYPHLLQIYTFAANPQTSLAIRNDSLVGLTQDQRKALGEAGMDRMRAQARERALGAARQWIHYDPNAKEAYDALVNAQVAAGQYAEAAATLRTALGRPGVDAPDFRYRLAHVELLAGKPKDAMTSLRQAMESAPADTLRANAALSRFMTVFASASVAVSAGRASDLERVARIVTETDPTLPGTYYGGQSSPTSIFTDPWVALAKAAMGIDWKAVRAPIDRTVRNFNPEREGVPGQARQANTALAYSAFVLSRDTTYLGYVKKWSGMKESEAPVEARALLALVRGDSAGARRLVAAGGSGNRTPGYLFHDFIAADVLAETGDLRGAIQRYEAIDTKTFAQMQGVPDPRWALYARSHLVRGQLYEELGERAEAEAAYQQFIDLWQDADPALQPQVTAAKTAVARLRDRPAAQTSR